MTAAGSGRTAGSEAVTAVAAALVVAEMKTQLLELCLLASLEESPLYMVAEGTSTDLCDSSAVQQSANTASDLHIKKAETKFQ